MRIAYVVSDLTYPPREGLHQQSLLVIDALARAGHDVRVFGFVRDRDSLDQERLMIELSIAIDRMASYRGSSLLAALLTRVAPLRKLTGAGGLLDAVNAGGFDVVHLDGALASAMAPGIESPAVLSWVDPGSLRFRRLSTDAERLLRGIALRAVSRAYYCLEASLASPSRIWHVVSEPDAEYLRRTHRRMATSVMAIPVMLPDPRDRQNVAHSPSPSEDAVVTVYADLRQPHLRSGAVTFLNALARSGARAHVVLLGRVASLPGNPLPTTLLTCTTIEWADDYEDVLARSTVVVLPDSAGTGLKNRAIQSMGMGVPTLGTNAAFEGIDVGGSLRRSAADPEEPAKLTSESLRDPALLDALGAEGPALVEREFGRESVARRWTSLYSRVQTTGRSTSSRLT